MSLKKFLLTSALVAGFAGNAFAASGLTVTLGGSLDTQLGYRNAKHKAFQHYDLDITNPKTKLQDVAIVNDTRIHVKADGNHAGLKYGGMVVINADTSPNKYTQLSHTNSAAAGGGGLNIGTSLPGDTLDSSNNNIGFQTMVYVSSAFGRVEAGSYTGAYDALRVSADSVARATGGASVGDAQYWINPVIMTSTPGTYGMVADRFWINANLPSNYNTGGQAEAAKVTYYTPEVYGVKAGVTFIPDLEQKGSVANTHTVLKDQSTGSLPYKDVVSAGIHYSGHVQKLHVKAALTGETGSAKAFNASTTAHQGRHKLSAMEAGVSVKYMGFGLAGSYGNVGKSGLVKPLAGATANAGKKKTSYWTVGGSYEYGHAGLSLSYMNSQRGQEENAYLSSNKYTNWTVGVDYKLAPGFMPYAEVAVYQLNEKNLSSTTASSAQQNNKGTVVLAGTKLQF